MANGFINNDLRSDLVTINQAQNAFQVHYYEKTQEKYNSSMSYLVDGTISSIFISKDDVLLQNLYVVYWKKFEDDLSYIKVFKQTREYVFEEYQESDLNMLHLHSHS